MKYRKKPVVIDAMQFTDVNKDVVYSWAKDQQSNISNGFDDDNNPQLIIPTLEGEMRADINDWIIKGVKGEIYPCKPDIFKLTYEEL